MNALKQTKMVELSEKAANYAAEKTNEMMTTLVAQAYEDGYRDGYKDRENEIPVNLRDNKKEYIDLGLPSGTLWSSDYEKEDEEILYLSFDKAKKMNIPTSKQIEELMSECKWEYEYKWPSSFKHLTNAKCVGPNGNILYFKVTGKKNIDSVSEDDSVYVWIADDILGDIKSCMSIHFDRDNNICHNEYDQFKGYHLPIRLVKKAN